MVRKAQKLGIAHFDLAAGILINLLSLLDCVGIVGCDYDLSIIEGLDNSLEAF